MAKLATNLKVIVQVNQTFFLVVFYFSVFLSIFPTTDVGLGLREKVSKYGVFWSKLSCIRTEYEVYGVNLRI